MLERIEMPDGSIWARLVCPVCQATETLIAREVKVFHVGGETPEGALRCQVQMLCTNGHMDVIWLRLYEATTEGGIVSFDVEVERDDPATDSLLFTDPKEP